MFTLYYFPFPHLPSVLTLRISLIVWGSIVREVHSNGQSKHCSSLALCQDCMIFPLSILWRAPWLNVLCLFPFPPLYASAAFPFSWTFWGVWAEAPTPDTHTHTHTLGASSPPGLDWDASLSHGEICTPVTLGSLHIPHSACRRTPLGGHSSQCPVVSRGRMNIKFICLWQWEPEARCLIFSHPVNSGWRTGLYRFHSHHIIEIFIITTVQFDHYSSSLALACLWAVHVGNNGKTLKVNHSGIWTLIQLACGE